MSSEIDDFERELMLEMQKELEKVSLEIKETLKRKVQENLYNSYNPKEYDRSGQMINNIAISKNDKEAIIGWENQEYINNQGTDVSSCVPTWVNEGYGSSPFDYYSGRPESSFIEEVVEEINRKYGYNICEKIEW